VICDARRYVAPSLVAGPDQPPKIKITVETAGNRSFMSQIFMGPVVTCDRGLKDGFEGIYFMTNSEAAVEDGWFKVQFMMVPIVRSVL
jgi:hypothetical protein